MTSLTIAFVTGNLGKVTSATEHLAPLGIEVKHVALKLDEIQPESNSTEEVAIHKAQQAFRALKCPLIVEDSGFHIDEFQGYPGPDIKRWLEFLGPKGIAHIANLTETRACRFSSTLVYMDPRGIPRLFTDIGDTCTVAAEPAVPTEEVGWSRLWDVVIPAGGSAPLSVQPPEERAAEAQRWAQRSVFRTFGEWLRSKTATG